MDPLPPIPTPLSRRLQNFTVRFVPILGFAVALAGVVHLWPIVGATRSAVGIAEAPRTFVASPQPATVTSLLVAPHSAVRRGDPIAIVEPVDASATLDLLQSRIDLARLAATPTLAEENAVQIERLRIDLIRTRSELAIARVRLDFANRDVARNEPLARDRLVSVEALDLSRSNRDLLQAEVQEKAGAVRAVEERLRVLESATSTANAPAVSPELLSELTSLHTDLSERQGAITLHAPIDGIVGDPLRQPGEFVLEGEPIVPVHHDRAQRIVAYLRQPFPEDPRPGLPVQVTRRTAGRPRFDTVIRHVGPQFETITNALALIREGALVDSGLPVILDVPESLRLLPGEVVDLVIRRGVPPGTPSEPAPVLR